ncbi:hypothetical protein M9H77_06276 [Catharanthus roseus]|uniref:Uncharacterized protein n=1 Tax=Catharanthus roseus TaxID=4058 RepID=A0ACC0BRV1_CATRO|nr:hypothetical protein M9H77_06276 [Catharanthus roseus]
MRMVLISLEQQRKLGLLLEGMNNDDEMCYIWTIRPNISKEGIHHTNISTEKDYTNIPQHVTTITQIVFDELLILYLSVEEDDDDNDNTDEDYVVSSESDDDNDDNNEEDDISTPINPLFSTTVNQ